MPGSIPALQAAARMCAITGKAFGIALDIAGLTRSHWPQSGHRFRWPKPAPDSKEEPPTRPPVIAARFLSKPPELRLGLVDCFLTTSLCLVRYTARQLRPGCNLSMSTTPEHRQSNRIVTKNRASLLVSFKGHRNPKYQLTQIHPTGRILADPAPNLQNQSVSLTVG